jgi:hypothetical protein
MEQGMQKRRRFKQTQSLEVRLAEAAKALREQAKRLPQGSQRQAIQSKALQAETAFQVCESLRLPGTRASD